MCGACECRSPGGLKRAADSLELEWKVTERCPVSGLGTWLQQARLSWAQPPTPYYFSNQFLSSSCYPVHNYSLHQSADIFTSLAGLDCTPSLLEEGGWGGSCDFKWVCSYQSLSVTHSSALTAHNIDLGRMGGSPSMRPQGVTSMLGAGFLLWLPHCSVSKPTNLNGSPRELYGTLLWAVCGR